jgi:hypothetical protein
LPLSILKQVCSVWSIHSIPLVSRFSHSLQKLLVTFRRADLPSSEVVKWDIYSAIASRPSYLICHYINMRSSISQKVYIPPFHTLQHTNDINLKFFLLRGYRKSNIFYVDCICIKYKLLIPVSLQVLMAASIKMAVFWDVTPCNFVEIN